MIFFVTYAFAIIGVVVIALPLKNLYDASDDLDEKAWSHFICVDLRFRLQTKAECLSAADSDFKQFRLLRIGTRCMLRFGFLNLYVQPKSLCPGYVRAMSRDESVHLSSFYMIMSYTCSMTTSYPFCLFFLPQCLIELHRDPFCLASRCQ